MAESLTAWLLDNNRAPSRRVWFEIDAPSGEPSKWLPMFAGRVLAWWN